MAVLVTPRSAERVTVVEAVSESLVEFESAGDWAETVAVLEIELTVEPGLIWARIRIVLVSPEASGPTALVPVQELPVDGLQAWTVSLHDALPICSVDKVSVSVAEVPLDGP